MNMIRNWLYRLPPPAGGVALGVGSITNAWLAQSIALPDYIIDAVWLSMALVIFALVTKYLLHPGQLKQDIACPATGSVLPTTAMAAMVLTTFISSFDQPLAKIIWSLAVIVHLLLFAGFCRQQIKAFELKNMLPGWFVPPVGIGVAAVTAPSVDMHQAGEICLWMALISYMIILPVMLYRLVAIEPIHPSRKPMLAILAAPPNLCMAGLLTLHPDPPQALLLPLLVLAMIMTGCVYLMLLHLLRQPFTPAWAAMTFPLAISCLAQCKAAISLNTVLPSLAETVAGLAQVQLLLATLIISYIALRYLTFFRPHRTA